MEVLRGTTRWKFFLQASRSSLKFAKPPETSKTQYFKTKMLKIKKIKKRVLPCELILFSDNSFNSAWVFFTIHGCSEVNISTHMIWSSQSGLKSNSSKSSYAGSQRQDPPTLMHLLCESYNPCWLNMFICWILKQLPEKTTDVKHRQRPQSSSTTLHWHRLVCLYRLIKSKNWFKSWFD